MNNLISSMRTVNEYMAEGVPKMNEEFSSRPWHLNREEDDESTSKEVVDHFRYDPFGRSTPTLAAISTWLDDLKVECASYKSSSTEIACEQGRSLFPRSNMIWNNSLKFVPFPCSVHLNQTQNMFIQSIPSNLQVIPARDSCRFDMRSTEGCFEVEGELGDVFSIILSYLGVKDLLSVEMVCKSLSSAVRDNPMLWKTIHIDQPLNSRITDEVLVQLTSRAQGNLECLSLEECPKITDDVLTHVLVANQQLTKLRVPGCTRLNIECIMNYIKNYNYNNKYGGIKHVRIGELYGMNYKRLQELKSLLSCGCDKSNGSLNSFLGCGCDKNNGRQQKPHFYIRGKFYLSYDDDRAIDIEICPGCERLRLIYDCPCEGCKIKDLCRTCTRCIERCVECGWCVNDTIFKETFGLAYQCWTCLK